LSAIKSAKRSRASWGDASRGDASRINKKGNMLHNSTTDEDLKDLKLERRLEREELAQIMEAQGVLYQRMHTLHKRLGGVSPGELGEPPGETHPTNAQSPQQSLLREGSFYPGSLSKSSTEAKQKMAVEMNMRGRTEATRGELMKAISNKRRGRIPPFIAHPIIAIGLFIYGAYPYLLIDHRREYASGVQHEFGHIIEDFDHIHDIDQFYTWYDKSLTAEESFNKYFRTGEAASEFALFAISNNTFNVLAVTQTRDGCFTEDELQGSGKDPTKGEPITSQNWRCGVASHQQCKDIPCTAAGGLFDDGACILDMAYMDVNDPDKGLRTPQAPPNMTNYELAEECVLQQFIHPNTKEIAKRNVIVPSVRKQKVFTLIPANLWHRNLSAVDIGTLFSQSMQKVNYIDVDTRSVSIWVMANAASFMKGSICLLEFNIDFSITGAVSPSINVSPMVHFFEDEPWWPRMPYIIYLIYIGISNLRELHANTTGGFLVNYLAESGHWILADICLIVLSVFFYTHIAMQQGHQQDTGVAFEYLLETEHYTFPSGCSARTLTGDCNTGMDTLEQTVSLSISYGQKVARIATVVMIVLTFRLFRYFRLQPELAIISNTLVRAFPDIVNLVGIMMVMMAGFAQCAVFAWGAAMDQFATLPKAFMTMFLILIGELGDHYEAMVRVNEPFTNLFMILYILLCFIVAMNIFLAIVCDAYEEERKEHGNYADDDTPGIFVGSVDQILAMGHQAKRFMKHFRFVRHIPLLGAAFSFGQHTAVKKLSWREQCVYEGINWADISRAIAKMDVAKGRAPEDSDIITATMLSQTMSTRTTPISEKLARVLLDKYSREQTYFASPTTLFYNKVRNTFARGVQDFTVDSDGADSDDGKAERLAALTMRESSAKGDLVLAALRQQEGLDDQMVAQMQSKISSVDASNTSESNTSASNKAAFQDIQPPPPPKSAPPPPPPPSSNPFLARDPPPSVGVSAENAERQLTEMPPAAHVRRQLVSGMDLYREDIDVGAGGIGGVRAGSRLPYDDLGGSPDRDTELRPKALGDLTVDCFMVGNRHRSIDAGNAVIRSADLDNNLAGDFDPYAEKSAGRGSPTPSQLLC
jgi:hypothetical protein